jgi:DNA-binding NarL/FixJ family response regulator
MPYTREANLQSQSRMAPNTTEASPLPAPRGIVLRRDSRSTSAAVASNSIVASVPKPRTRIVLVEDHAILREGLKALIEIEPDFEIVGAFGCDEDALVGIHQLQPDLVLTHLAFSGGSGFELLLAIRRVAPRARKLVLTAYDSEEYIRAALNAGADGYVLKDANRVELMQAIRTVSAGQKFLSEALANKMSGACVPGGEPRRNRANAQSITGREREVLTRIALGDSNKAIAHALALSVKTIEKHRSNLMRKLRLHNTAGITLFAVRNGLAGGT